MDDWPSRLACLEVATGRRPADLLLANAKVVNVYSGRIVDTGIAIVRGRIAGLGRMTANEVVDMQGRYVAPGFVDAHVHVESTMASVDQFARAVLPCGTTTVIADPHEIANVLGTAGIDYMLRAAEGQPLNIYYGLPSCVPATDMETAGAQLEIDQLEPYMGHPRVVALGEVMNFPGVLGADASLLAKIDAARRRRLAIDGHAPGLGGALLQAYAAAGIASDHECTDWKEAREKLEAGLHVMVREGTGARNLDALLPLINERTAWRMMWCTDDRHLADILRHGHIDSMVRRAIAGGVDPVRAIQMATVVPAGYFSLPDRGAVAAGKIADLVVFSDLASPVAEQVYSAGRLVAADGRVLPSTDFPEPAAAPTAMRVDAQTVDFSVAATGRRLRVIQIVADQIVTRQIIMDARLEYGLAVADPDRDLLKIAVVERYSGSGQTGIGFIRGLGLSAGALASSVAHDCHNLIVAGTGDADMQIALAAVAEMGGGLALALDGRVVARLALPIAGLMTSVGLESIAADLDALMAAASRLGCRLADPWMTLSFMALPVIPSLKLTDRGLVDVDRFEPVALFVDGNQPGDDGR